MSYNEDDIREIFRRAFEERGGDRGDRGGDGEPPRPRPRTPGSGRPMWRDRRFWFVTIGVLLLLSFNWVVTTYTDWLWFESVGYADVWLKRWGVQLIAFVVFFVIALAVLLINLRIAMAGAVRSSSSSFQPGQYPGFSGLALGMGGVLAFLFALTGAARWELFLQYIYRGGSTITDPIFGQSLSFYFFELPFYRFLQGWFMPLIVFTLLGIGAIYALHNLEAIRLGRWQPQTLDPLRRHAAVLGALAALLTAADHLLARFNLVYMSRNEDILSGAGFTDVTYTAPIYNINAVLMVIVAVALLLNIPRLNWRPLVAAGALWLISVILVRGVVPGLVQNYVVDPNELGRERPYIRYNIDYTRMAYGLDKMEERDLGAVASLDQQDLADNAEALINIRLWDYRVLPENYEQLQALRNFYRFGDIDIDRYEIDGEMRQVMLSGRELDKSQLPNNTWVNQKLEYTHGFGVVMNPVDRFTRDGQPEFFISDLPPDTPTNIKLTRPEIYFGELMDDYVFAGSARPEINYPTGNQNVRSSYEGTGGVEMSNPLRRLALAVRFGDINVLLNDDITPQTKAMYFRTITERVGQITPFLSFDPDPYLVVVDGRLVWMMDAYTTSPFYPYSERTSIRTATNLQTINYIRNVAKVTVDAYNGTVSYYLLDEEDPIVAAYAAAFPGLFQPFTALPEALQGHVRYPELLFRVQTRQFLRYHMTDVEVFYGQSDVWAIPQETFANNTAVEMEPYYVIFRLPGEAETEYLLIQPYTLQNRPNMVAWVAARNDPATYGQLIVYRWRSQDVAGPIQVEGRIDQDTEVSQQITLWSQQGSEVIRGNLIVIPLNNAFLYVEPLFLRSETNPLPELKRVIVSNGFDVIMRPTLAEALAGLLDASVADIVEAVPVDLGDVDSAESDETPAPVLDESVESLIQSANAHFEAAQAAQQAGDWATYGAELDALERDLQRLIELSGQP